MGNMVIATTFIVILNLLMWFSTVAMLDVNPTGNMCFNLDGSIIGNSITKSGDYLEPSNDILSDLPNSDGTSIAPGDSTVSFTDIFSNILNWFKSAPGIKYIYAVAAAPYNILKCMNLPSVFVAGIGTMWYLISFLVLLSFMWGRD